MQNRNGNHHSLRKISSPSMSDLLHRRDKTRSSGFFFVCIFSTVEKSEVNRTKRPKHRVVLSRWKKRIFGKIISNETHGVFHPKRARDKEMPKRKVISQYINSDGIVVTKFAPQTAPKRQRMRPISNIRRKGGYSSADGNTGYRLRKYDELFSY